jgi:predicted GNAT family N-acyltransferase
MKLVEPGTSDELERYYRLRWEVLRKPWQQPYGSEKDALEAVSIHVMVVEEDYTALGVGRLHFNTVGIGQVRYMAILASHRGRGIGNIILSALEQTARQQGAREIVVNARNSAVGFYERNGYVTVGPAHTLYDSIVHTRMLKILRSLSE